MENTSKIQSKKRSFVCGSLTLDTLTGLAHSNKKREVKNVLFKRGSHDRFLLEYFMKNQRTFFTYKELLDLLDSCEKECTAIKVSKTANDKIDAIKKKLLPLNIDRDELENMFVCQNGYALYPPSEGKKFRPQK